MLTDPAAARGEEGLRGDFEGTRLHRAQGTRGGNLSVRCHAPPGSLQEPRQGELMFAANITVAHG